MSSPQPSQSSQPPIWHTTSGSPSHPPLLLLHGIFCSHLEFTPLLPFLQSSFFLILVDLPAHSLSHTPSTPPPRLPSTTTALAHLIRTVSPTGTAHVAGMSYGSFVALSLARSHPSVVLSLFASGAPPFQGKEAFFAARPWLMWPLSAPVTYMPDALFKPLCRWFGITIPPGLRAANRQNFSWALLRDGYADCLSVTIAQVGEIRGVRVAAVAGGKQDNVEVTRRIGVVLREGDGGSGCQAFVVRKAIHAWDLQYPDLFAEGIRAWVEGREMPGEFEELV